MKKEKTIETPELSISGNIMKWENSIIQLSNISSISTVPLSVQAFPWWTIILIVLGMSIFDTSVLIALLMFAISAIIIFSWYQKNKEIKTKKFLVILTNSGISFSFLFNNKKFLDEVLHVLSCIIAEGKTTNHNIKININNSTITNSQVLSDLSI